MLKNGLMEGIELVGLELNTKILAARGIAKLSEQFFYFRRLIMSQEWI